MLVLAIANEIRVDEKNDEGEEGRRFIGARFFLPRRAVGKYTMHHITGAEK